MMKVTIGRKVEPKDLEGAVIRAADEMGWKAKAKDDYDEQYKLGSVHEVRIYRGREISLRRILPKLM